MFSVQVSLMLRMQQSKILESKFWLSVKRLLRFPQTAGLNSEDKVRICSATYGTVHSDPAVVCLRETFLQTLLKKKIKK